MAWSVSAALNGPDVSISKVYYPQEGGIQVHLSRVKPCPPNFPAGFFWYGGKRRGPGRPPKWVEQFLDDKEVNTESDMTSGNDTQGNHTAQDNLSHQSVSTATDNGPSHVSTQQNRMTGKYNLRHGVRHPKKQFD